MYPNDDQWPWKIFENHFQNQNELKWKAFHWLESFKLFFRYPDRLLEFSSLWTLPQVLENFSRKNLRKFTTFLKFWARSYANTIGIFRYFYAFLAVFVHTNSILVSLLEIFWTWNRWFQTFFLRKSKNPNFHSTELGIKFGIVWYAAYHIHNVYYTY